LRAWLEDASERPPEEAAAALKDQLKRLSAAHGFRVRLKMLDIMAEETRRITGAFEADLNKALHPLSTALQHKVVIGNDLLKYHGKSYRTAAAGSGQLDRPGQRRPSAAHAGPCHGYGASAPDPGLPRLCAGFEIRLAQPAQPLPHGAVLEMPPHSSDAGDSPHTVYVKTLLLALAEPVQLAPGDLDRVRFFLDRYAELAELQDLTLFLRKPDIREGCFLIRHNEDGPGRSLQKWHNIEIRSGDLLLDCGPLLARMRSQIDALEHGVLPSKIGLPSVASAIWSMMKTCWFWGEPPSRRSQRLISPRVEIAVGLDDLWSLLSGVARFAAATIALKTMPRRTQSNSANGQSSTARQVSRCST
jgi:hypothetical protein